MREGTRGAIGVADAKSRGPASVPLAALPCFVAVADSGAAQELPLFPDIEQAARSRGRFVR